MIELSGYSVRHCSLMHWNHAWYDIITILGYWPELPALIGFIQWNPQQGIIFKAIFSPDFCIKYNIASMDKMKNNLKGDHLFQVCHTLYFFFAEPPNFFFIFGYTTKIMTIIAPIMSTSNVMFLSLSQTFQFFNSITISKFDSSFWKVYIFSKY